MKNGGKGESINISINNNVWIRELFFVWKILCYINSRFLKKDISSSYKMIFSEYLNLMLLRVSILIDLFTNSRKGKAQKKWFISNTDHLKAYPVKHYKELILLNALIFGWLKNSMNLLTFGKAYIYLHYPL